jgi:predicted aspartyl protease
MGTFTQRLILRGASNNGAQRPSEVVDALVDTGAMFSSIPSEILERLSVKPFRTLSVHFADGAVRDMPMGQVEAELNGVASPILCLFGVSGVPALLGAHALEAFLVMVDPVERKLVPREAFLM